jgi:hypothetical protein
MLKRKVIAERARREAGGDVNVSVMVRVEFRIRRLVCLRRGGDRRTVRVVLM